MKINDEKWGKYQTYITIHQSRQIIHPSIQIKHYSDIYVYLKYLGSQKYILDYICKSRTGIMYFWMIF